MPIKTFAYRDRSGTYYLEPFRSFAVNTTMDDHINGLLEDGWELLNSASDGGHVRVGKTLALSAMTGGLSLLFGASRTKKEVTLTFKK
jgi:hypothetical protein